MTISEVDVAVKVTDSPSQKSVSLKAVELKLTCDGLAKFTIANVTLLFAVEVSVTPNGKAFIAIVVVPALEKDKSVGHLNFAYPPGCIVFAVGGVPGEEKWELLKIAVAVPEFAPANVNVTFKLLAVKSKVFVVLRLWTSNSKSRSSLKQYLTSEPSAGIVTYDLSFNFRSRVVWENTFSRLKKNNRNNKFLRIYRYGNLELIKFEQ